MVGDGIYWGRVFFSLLAKFLEIPVTLIQTGAFYNPLEVTSLQSSVVNYLMGSTRTGKGIAPSTSTSTQQDKNILELIMDLITRNYQQFHHLHSGSRTVLCGCREADWPAAHPEWHWQPAHPAGTGFVCCPEDGSMDTKLCRVSSKIPILGPELGKQIACAT